MNQQNNTTAASTRPTTVSRPPHMSRKKPDPALLRILRGTMLVLGGMIFIVGLLLLILPMFRVQKIKVEGNTYYTQEEIMAASGIKLGEQEMLTLDGDEVRRNIWDWDVARHIDNIAVKRYFTTVVISVSEPKNVMYTEFNGKFYSINRDFRVLRESENEADFAEYPKIELPEIAALAVGATLRFENADADLSYITSLLDTLEARGILANVTSLDVSAKYSVSYVTGNSCRVEIGKVDQMETKLALVGEILNRRGESDSSFVELDVSDIQKPTWRTVDLL